MGCSSCYYTEHWGAINRTDEIFDCPKCGAHTFKFVSWQGAELKPTSRGLVPPCNLFYYSTKKFLYMISV